MANTNTFYRKANVPSADAITALTSRYPKAQLVSFETRKAASASEAASASVKIGEQIYVATVRVAEFPPVEDSGEEKPEAPKPEGSDEGDSEKSESDDSEGDNPFAGGDEDGEGGDKPVKQDKEDILIHLLTEIVHALKGGAGGPEGPPGAGGPGDLDLPDVGAPPAGGPGLPPPGGPGGKPPLPPPIKEKSPVGVGAFASVASMSEAHLVRADANEIGNKALIKEVEEFAPGKRVARIQRTGSAKINGNVVNLPDANVAVVTLVRK